jgi:hypothetical protein
MELAQKFAQFLEDPDTNRDIFADNVFCDMNVPSWRFQLQGLQNLVDHLKEEEPNGLACRLGPVTPTETGMVLEVYCQQPNEQDYYRQMWLLRTADGQISEIAMYCTGPWDKATRERQAKEAPMIR